MTIIKGLQQQRVYKSVLIQTEVKTMQWKSKQIVHHHSATKKQNNFGLAIFSICFFCFFFRIYINSLYDYYLSAVFYKDNPVNLKRYAYQHPGVSTPNIPMLVLLTPGCKCYLHPHVGKPFFKEYTEDRLIQISSPSVIKK